MKIAVSFDPKRVVWADFHVGVEILEPKPFCVYLGLTRAEGGGRMCTSVSGRCVMANVWFISDIHGGHKNICKYREFNSEEEHFNIIKDNYHAVVTKRDKVFFLGDIAFTQERLEDIGGWVGEQKVLILGNHDTDSIHIRQIINHFDSVYSLLRYKEFWISHAPLHEQELRGKVNLHGHVHNATIQDSRYFNCCLENTNYSPISLQGIREIIEERDKS